MKQRLKKDGKCEKRSAVRRKYETEKNAQASGIFLFTLFIFSSYVVEQLSNMGLQLDRSQNGQQRRRVKSTLIFTRIVDGVF